MRMKPQFLAVIVDLYFPPFSLKTMFVRPRGPSIVMSASPLCTTGLCRRCSTKQPHWNAANAPPLWHETHFIDTYFSTPWSTIRCIWVALASGWYSTMNLYIPFHKYTDAHSLSFLTPLNVSRNKALCCIEWEWSQLYHLLREYIESGLCLCLLIVKSKRL